MILKNTNIKKSFKYILTFVAVSVIAGCEEDINEYRNCNLKTTFVDTLDIINYSDKVLINFARYGNKYLPGFYIENLSNSSIYYINTVSIQASNQWIYLCTNDSSQAFDWINLSTDRTLTDFIETEKYFQARGLDTTQSKYHILFRVHKCSYIDRSIYDALNRTDSLGYFNKRPIDEINTKEVIEYLWFIQNYDFGNPKVLFTEYNETQDECIYVLYITNYYVGDWGMCPSVNVEKQIYSINKTTGLILYNTKIIRVISDP